MWDRSLRMLEATLIVLRILIEDTMIIDETTPNMQTTHPYVSEWFVRFERLDVLKTKHETMTMNVKSKQVSIAYMYIYIYVCVC